MRRYRERIREENERNAPDLDAPKCCGRCGETKHGRDFHRNRTAPDGLRWVCRDCSNQARRDGGGAELDRQRHYKDYGMSLEELAAMLDGQEDRCAICRSEFDDGLVPHVDHCHETGIVRGLLCIRCNTGIGLLGDDPALLEAAIRYLGDPPAVLGEEGVRYARGPTWAHGEVGSRSAHTGEVAGSNPAAPTTKGPVQRSSCPLLELALDLSQERRLVDLVLTGPAPVGRRPLHDLLERPA